MNDRSDNPSHHEQMLLPRSYISLQIEKMPNEENSSEMLRVCQKLYNEDKQYTRCNTDKWKWLLFDTVKV